MAGPETVAIGPGAGLVLVAVGQSVGQLVAGKVGLC